MNNIQEAVKKDFINALRDGTFEKVSGNAVGNGFYIYKSPIGFIGWTVADIASGLMIKDGFKLQTEARDFAVHMPDDIREKVEEIRTSDKYKNACEKLKDAVIKESLSVDNVKSFTEAYDSLSEEEIPQKELFELI